MAIEIKAPEPWARGKFTIFLAGAIDQNKAEDWQTQIVEALADYDVLILNPRRDDWDSSWEQSASDPQFREQVVWEQQGLEEADFRTFVLLDESKAPITLLELGENIDRPGAVCCEPEYYRKGNVDISSALNEMPVFESLDGLIGHLTTILEAKGLNQGVSKVASERTYSTEEVRAAGNDPWNQPYVKGDWRSGIAHADTRYALRDVPMDEIRKAMGDHMPVPEDYRDGGRTNHYEDGTDNEVLYVRKMQQSLKGLPPIVLTSDLLVLDGNHRLAAYNDAGATTIPAFVVVPNSEETHTPANEAASSKTSHWLLGPKTSATNPAIAGSSAGTTSEESESSEVEAPAKLPVTETPAFKTWFVGSKVVDANGNPLVVYHGTEADFDAFDTELKELGSHFGSQVHANARAGNQHAVGANVRPCYLSIKNPLRLVDVGGFSASEIAGQLVDKGVLTETEMWKAVESADFDGPEIKRKIIAAGYDGVVYLNRGEGLEDTDVSDLGDTTDEEFNAALPHASDSWIAFYPNQIKSAIGNSGQFDPENQSVTAATSPVTPNPQPGFQPWYTDTPRGVLDDDFEPAERPVTETPEFQAWFKGSKVVDADGNPLVAYHATSHEGKTFSNRNKGYGQFGHWFDAKPGLVESYALGDQKQHQPNVITVFLLIKNPKVFPDTETFRDAVDGKFGPNVPARAQKLRTDLKKQGFDGALIHNSANPDSGRPDFWVAFDTKQIKSALGNSGDFDPKNKSIVSSAPPPPLSDQGLTQFAELARGNKIGSRPAVDGDCEPVTEELYLLLTKQGYRPAMVAGEFEGRSHTWLTLQNQIIDATFDQFDSSTPISILPVAEGEDQGYEANHSYTWPITARDQRKKAKLLRAASGLRQKIEQIQSDMMADVDKSFDTGEIDETGNPWGNCTTGAEHIIDLVGQGDIFGYTKAQNPTAEIADGAGEGGHDFAIIGDLLVDFWASDYNSTPGIIPLSDHALITKLYGDPHLWQKRSGSTGSYARLPQGQGLPPQLQNVKTKQASTTCNCGHTWEEHVHLADFSCKHEGQGCGCLGFDDGNQVISKHARADVGTFRPLTTRTVATSKGLKLVIEFSPHEEYDGAFRIVAKTEDGTAVGDAVLGRVEGHVYEDGSGETPDSWEAINLWVDPKWRRQGVASAMYDAFEASGRVINPAGLSGHGGKRSPDAIDFWTHRDRRKKPSTLLTTRRKPKAEVKQSGLKVAATQEQMMRHAEAYEDQWSEEAKGYANNGHPAYFEAKSLDWKDEPNFELRRIHGFTSDAKGWKWLARDLWDRLVEQYARSEAKLHYDDLKQAITDRTVDPIVAVEGTDGQFYLWDGNHRVALAYLLKVGTMHAIVGYQKTASDQPEPTAQTLEEAPNRDA